MTVRRFRSTGPALIRAAAHSGLELPSWPDLSDPEHVQGRVEWLRRVWAVDLIAEAIDHASPEFGRRVRQLCVGEVTDHREARGVALSVARYLQRITGRSTPFGLMAGVSVASFGPEPRWGFGDRHQVVVHAGAEWLAKVIAQLEGRPDLLAQIPVMANNTMVRRGDRLIVPHQGRPHGRGIETVEVSIRYVPVVRAAVEAVQTPIGFGDLCTKVQADLPSAPEAKVRAALTELVARRVLITSLRAPSTEPDALAHLVDQLMTAAPAAAETTALRGIHRLLGSHKLTSDDRSVRDEAAARMRDFANTRRHPLAADLRLDLDVVLPDQVAREVERAATVLARLSAYPFGTPAWRAYHQRFYERYGLGALVPLLDMVADSGIGWPDGYPGAVEAEQPSPLSSRDDILLNLAQEAAFDGRHEVVIDERLIESLGLGVGPLRPPPHLEVGVRVYSPGLETLRRGDFRLEVVTVSRGAGVLTGRFLNMLPPADRAALQAGLCGLPNNDQDTMTVQMSFPPLDPATEHITRAPEVHSTVISLAEHRERDGRVITPDRLAVGCDGRRMFLVDVDHEERVEAVGMHALNLLTHTPPLARLVTELSRAHCSQVTTFDWKAAKCLPFLPRLRSGRTILSPARWRLTSNELPSWPTSPLQWNEALTRWRSRYRVPRLVHLVEGDQELPLDLDEAMHRALLRAHLTKSAEAALTEAPTADDLGWCGGRPHDVVVPLAATEPPPWPRLPKPSRTRIVRPHHDRSPSLSGVLLASLYGEFRRQDAILTQHLPTLFAGFEHPPAWWYIRYRDPEQHLRLRIRMTDRKAFGETTRKVSAWADELRQSGLLREVRYPTDHPETGRWGSGAAWAATEEVFRTDSQAVLVQLGQPIRPDLDALVAAQAVAIARAFTGSTLTGMQWLIDHIPAAAPTKILRSVFDEARRIADPRDDWAALRAMAGGAAIADAWTPRDDAIAAYRRHFPSPDTQGIDPDSVLSSLIHLHFVRAHGIDFDKEAAGMYLARAAALAWSMGRRR